MYYNRVVSVKHYSIYALITIRLATCFNPTESSSGLHYEPGDVGHEPFTFTFVNIVGILRMYAAF
jgi:hypothetical protein